MSENDNKNPEEDGGTQPHAGEPENVAPPRANRDSDDCAGAPATEQQQSKKSTENFERAMLIINGVLCFATVVYALVSLCTLKALNAQIGQADRQFTNSQRPWIWPGATAPQFSGGSLVVDIPYKNSGISPAVRVRESADLVFEPDSNAQIEHFFSSATPGPQITVVAPGGGSTYHVGYPKIPASNATWEMKNNDKMFVLFRIWYSDARGNNYWSDYCQRWRGRENPGTWADCDAHNEAH